MQVNLMNIDEFNGRCLYSGLRLDYRLRVWAPTSVSCAVSAVAELLIYLLVSLTFGPTAEITAPDPTRQKVASFLSVVKF